MKTIAERKAELEATKSNQQPKTAVDTGISSEEFNTRRTLVEHDLTKPNPEDTPTLEEQIEIDLTKLNLEDTQNPEEQDVFASVTPISFGEDEESESKRESEIESQLPAEPHNPEMIDDEISDSESLRNSSLDGKAALDDKAEMLENLRKEIEEAKAQIQEIALNRNSLFSPRNSNETPNINSEKLLAELLIAEKHYSDPLNQTGERLMNFTRSSGHKKVTATGKPRAPAKAKAASDLMTLVLMKRMGPGGYVKLTTEEVAAILNKHKITAIEFCDGKASKIFSPEFITLFKGSAPAPRI